MKKTLTALLLGILVFTVGCSSSLEMPARLDSSDDATVKTAIFVGPANTKEVMHAIKTAAQKDGWLVTEFKINAFVLEKVVGEETVSTTIKFQNEHISGSHVDPNADKEVLLELRKAIVAELQAEDTEDSHSHTIVD